MLLQVAHSICLDKQITSTYIHKIIVIIGFHFFLLLFKF